MKIMKCFTVVVGAVVLALTLNANVFGQTSTTRTSLSTALSGGSANTTVVVVSGTGMTASTALSQNFIFVEGEQMIVTAVSTNTLTVRRAIRGSAVPHPVGATVWYGGPGSFNVNTGDTYGVFVGNTPYGTCTRTTNQFLPVINPNTGEISDCILSPALGLSATNLTTSKWVSVNAYQTAPSRPYKKLNTATVTYTALPTDYIIGANSTNKVSITLPAMTGWIGREYIVQNEASSAVSIEIIGSAGQLINGAVSIITGGSGTYSGFRIYSDGVNWFASRQSN